jgi:hypothetical protein
MLETMLMSMKVRVTVQRREPNFGSGRNRRPGSHSRGGSRISSGQRMKGIMQLYEGLESDSRGGSKSSFGQKTKGIMQWLRVRTSPNTHPPPGEEKQVFTRAEKERHHAINLSSFVRQLHAVYLATSVIIEWPLSASFWLLSFSSLDLDGSLILWECCTHVLASSLSNHGDLGKIVT